jgi:hypothetical protein
MTVSSSGGVVTSHCSPQNPVAVALLTMLPFSTSAAVTT